MDNSPQIDTPILPRRFPVLVGLGVAVVVGGGLFILGEIEAMPAPLWTVAGQMLIGAHALAAFALSCMIGDAVLLSRWSAELSRQESEAPETVQSGLVGAGINRVMEDLRRRYAVSEMRAAVAKRADILLREYTPRWWIGTAVAFLIPLFGGLAALWNLRIYTNAVPFREVGLPLLISVVEAMPILLLSTTLRRSFETALSRWKVAVEEIAGIQRPVGRIQPSEGEEEEKVIPTPSPPATPSPPPTPSPPTPSQSPRPQPQPPTNKKENAKTAFADKDEEYY
jgi:hypothetical protein